MQKVSFSQIVEQLYKIFSNEAEASQYTNTQSGAQYMGLCGWAGVMSPLNRVAFIKEFGQDVTDRAEREARARVAEYRAAYEASEYHRHELEAGQADPDQVPAVGSFVFGWTDWLKCEGGPMDPLKNHVNDWGSLRPELVEIAAVVEVEPAEFLSAETAHRIASEHQNQCGSRYNEADPLRLDGQPYAWTVGVLVVCRPYGDGEKSQTPARWYIVDSEGYDWARYILMPQRFASMYAEEIADLRAQRAAVEAQKEAEEQAAKAARLAEYRARCARWEGSGLVDVRPLIAAEEEANKAHGWRSAEAKSAARKLAAARRRNILTMCQAAAPGVKFSVKKWDGWGGSYEVSWTDGPTADSLKAAADLDILEEGRDTFDGMTDCAGRSRAEFVDFAAQYLGVFGEIRTSRDTSPEYRAEIIAHIREAVPGLPEDDAARIYDGDQQAAICSLYNESRAGYLVEYIERDGLRGAAWYIAHNTDRPTTSEAPTDPTPDNGGTGVAYGESEKSQTQEAPDGLTLEEIPGGVAVVGDSRATYKARREIKAHGARWNKAAQRWEATDPEAVESLCQWLTPAPVVDATPTEEAAPVAYGEAEKSQPQSEADRARVRLEEIRASIEAEAVSYGEIAELQNELRPYIAPDDLQLLEWASPEEETQELPAPSAAVVYDPAQPVERAEFVAVDAEGVAYGVSEKSQIFEAVEVSENLKVKEYRLMYLFGAWVCHSRIYAEDDAEAIHDAMDDYVTSTLPRWSHRVALWEGSRLVENINGDGPDEIGRRDIEMEKAETVLYQLEPIRGTWPIYSGGSILSAVDHIVDSENCAGERFCRLYADGVKIWDSEVNTKIELAAIVRQHLTAPYGETEKSPICEATEAAKELEAEMMAEAIAHHVRLKQQHPDALLLLRCGDFYELWLSDAEIGADVLRLTLTRRPDGVPICAFPYMALDTYLPKLVRAGHRVAICDDLRTKRRPRHQEATA